MLILSLIGSFLYQLRFIAEAIEGNRNTPGIGKLTAHSS